MTFDEAVAVLDQLTPIYRLAVEEVPPVERRVLYALALMPDAPQRLKDIAVRARMGDRTTASMLTRLKRRANRYTGQRFVIHDARRWSVADPWLRCYFRLRRHERFEVPNAPHPRLPSLWEHLLLCNASAMRYGRRL